jgi:threonine/homoserine/homoserine lactone efflux protein
MTWDGVAIFALSFAIVVATPGPGLAAFVGQILGHGVKAAPAFAVGIYLGDFFWFTLAATGLAALAHAFAGVFMVIKWLGAAYLLILAMKMWRAKPAGIEEAAARGPLSHRSLLVGGLAVTLSNPKAIVFYLAILPAIVNLHGLTISGYLTGLVVIALVLFPILAGYAIAANAARGLFREPGPMRILNRISGAAIAGAAVLIAARN